MKYTKIVINVIYYLKYFSLSVQIVFKYDYLSRKVWLMAFLYYFAFLVCFFLYLLRKHNYMGSHNISGLLNEVSLCIGQLIASGEDYSVLETAIKGNEEMIELRKNEILGKVADL